MGSTGPAGAPGPTGESGPTGNPGNTGPPGTPGPSGADGSTGLTGPMGPMGVTGMTGFQGATGAQGSQGPTGFFEDEICSLFDVDYGRCGRFYDFGTCPPSNFILFDSLTINPGEPDEQVFPFAPPLNLTDLHAFLQDNFQIFPISSTTYFTRPPTDVITFHITVPGFGPTLIPTVFDNTYQILLCGDSGPGFTECELFYSDARGPTGLRGAQGNTGAQGLDGFAAMMGDTGSQGPTGLQGMTGPQGVQGMDGFAAMMGDTGAQGAQGVTGFQGDMGMTGAQGAQGATGVTGAQGLRGSIIECGASFSGLSAGSDAEKSIPPLSTPPPGTQVGDFCLARDTGTLYQWDGATWEIVNPQPATPYVYFDTDTGILYDVDMQGSPVTVHVANEGDLFVGSGESFFLGVGPTGWVLCDTNGDLCTRLAEASIDCLGDVDVTGAGDRDYLCFEPSGTGGQWVASPVTLTVETATGATGPVVNSVTLNLPDTLRIFSPGTILPEVEEGSALVELNSNVHFSGNGDPNTVLPSGPTDPTRPAVYLDKDVNNLFFWDEGSVTWVQATSSGPGPTGAQGSQGFQGNTGAQGNQGFQGHTGAQGSQGFQGHTGAQGHQGPTGVAGVLNDISDVEVTDATAGDYLCFTGGEWVASPINVDDLGDTTITSVTGGEYLCYDGNRWVNALVPRQGNVVRCGDFFSGITADDAGSKPLVGPMVLGDLCLATNTGTLFEWDGATWQIVNPQPDRPYFYLDIDTGELYELSQPGPTGPPSLVDGMSGDVILTSNSSTQSVIFGTTGWDVCVDLCDSLGQVSLDCISDIDLSGATAGDYLCFTGGIWSPSPVITIIGAGFSLFATAGSTIIGSPTPISFASPIPGTNSHSDPVLGATELFSPLPGSIFSNPFPFPIRLDLSYHLLIPPPGGPPPPTVIEAFIDYDTGSGGPGVVPNQIYTSELIDFTAIPIPQTVSGSGVWTLAASGAPGDSLSLFATDLGGVGPFPLSAGPTGGSQIYGHITRIESLSDFPLPL